MTDTTTDTTIDTTYTDLSRELAEVSAIPDDAVCQPRELRQLLVPPAAGAPELVWTAWERAWFRAPIR